MASAQLALVRSAHPLDTIEHLASAQDWSFDRSADDEINISVEGSWAAYHISFNWREDLEGLHVACAFDFKVPAGRRDEVYKLIAIINEQLWLGHFDIWAQEGVLMFRNCLLLAGGAEANSAQCESLLHLAVEACERYFPAFQFVIWAGKNAEEAVESSLFETVGHA